MSERDPIAALVEALQRDGKPTLAWTIRWSAGNRDPVAAAWEASGDAGAMLALLASLVFRGRSRAIEMRQGAKLVMRAHRNGFPVVALSYGGDEVATAALLASGEHRSASDPVAIRALVHRVPTLAELLAASHRT